MQEKEIKIRQMMLDEWNAGTSQANVLRSINSKFGAGSVSKTKVNYWYTRFEKGGTGLANENRGTDFAKSNENPSVKKAKKQTLFEEKEYVSQNSETSHLVFRVWNQ